uniref:Uncharacterized protein n=1 Tax=Arundo donax TaxID=35708 RepID=A0A0A9B4I4_ARUDO
MPWWRAHQRWRWKKPWRHGW